MALQPTYGRLYSCFNIKHVFCYAIGLFGVGSIVCATAHSSEILILGRAIQGCGSAGAFSGGLLLCAYVVSKQKLPIYLALLSTMFMVASLVGPVIGGIFASTNLTWQFCFWINLRGCLILPSLCGPITDLIRSYRRNLHYHYGVFVY